MATDNEERKHFSEDKKAHWALGISAIPTFMLLLTLVWQQSAFQTTLTEKLNHYGAKQEQILESVDENGKLIKLNTIRLSEVENILADSVTREDLFHWLLELKTNNPDIKVPLPPKKSDK